VGSDLPSTGNCTDIDPDAAATATAAVVPWIVLSVGADRSVKPIHHLVTKGDPVSYRLGTT
jgi:hypothetical protein